VKPGDEWETDLVGLDVGLMTYAPGCKPVMSKYRYEGEERVGDVACHQVSMRVEGAEADLVASPELNDGLAMELHAAKIQASGDYFFSVEDGLLVLSKWSSGSSFKVHMHGMQKEGDQEQKVDMVATCENRADVGELRRN